MRLEVGCAHDLRGSRWWVAALATSMRRVLSHRNEVVACWAHDIRIVVLIGVTSVSSISCNSSSGHIANGLPKKVASGSMLPGECSGNLWSESTWEKSPLDRPSVLGDEEPRVTCIVVVAFMRSSPCMPLPQSGVRPTALSSCPARPPSSDSRHKSSSVPFDACTSATPVDVLPFATLTSLTLTSWTPSQCLRSS